MRTNAGRVLLPVAAGLLLAVLSIGVEGSARADYPEIMGCETGCTVAAGGWPVPFVVDYPGLSVVNSVHFLGAVRGEDRWRWPAFALTAAFWIVFAATAFMGVQSVIKRRR